MPQQQHMIGAEALAQEAHSIKARSSQETGGHQKKGPWRSLDRPLSVTQTEADQAGEAEPEGAEEVPGPHVRVRPEAAAEGAAVFGILSRDGQPRRPDATLIFRNEKLDVTSDGHAGAQRTFVQPIAQSVHDHLLIISGWQLEVGANLAYRHRMDMRTRIILSEQPRSDAR